MRYLGYLVVTLFTIYVIFAAISLNPWWYFGSIPNQTNTMDAIYAARAFWIIGSITIAGFILSLED